MEETGAGPKGALRRALGGLRWERIDCLPYKEDGAAPFKGVSRQILFSGEQLESELRYFEIAPGGFTTLERHAHGHAVMILRGEGRCLAGEAIYPVRPYDLITIEPWAWHQFRADQAARLGFLCLVKARRDRPMLPDAGDLAKLRANPEIAAFLDGR